MRIDYYEGTVRTTSAAVGGSHFRSIFLSFLSAVCNSSSSGLQNSYLYRYDLKTLFQSIPRYDTMVRVSRTFVNRQKCNSS